MDDQVKYSELIQDDNNGFSALLKALEDIKTKLSEVKGEAARLGNEMKNMGTATSEQQKAVSAHAAAMERLHKQAAELTEEEAKAIKFLADSLNFMNQNGTKNMNVWKNMTQGLDGFNMSYNQMKETVKVLEEALKSLSNEQQKNSEGAKSAAAAVIRLKESMKAFENQTKSTKDTIEKTSRAYSKLTEDEVRSLEQLKVALQGTSQEQIAAVQAIDIQSKSYNELYQTYNAIKDVLNKMTVAERENTEAGKEMVNRAKEIRDTLNNLQQQTGNYTLNVGNYMSALNGLQFQTQQLMREIPSAQNLTQFFLAISNNIPMFTDALARYNKGLPEARVKLAAVTAEITRQEAAMAGMNAQTTEYAAKQQYVNALKKQELALQGATVSGWRAILKVVGSWQTLLIAGLLLLRKIPDIVRKIAEWWDRWRNGVKEVKNEITAVAAMARLQADVIKKTADETTELRLVVEKLKEVKQGTDEWAAGVKTVNEITKSNLDTTKAQPAEIEKVTKAYMKQATQLAKNAVLSDMIANSMANLSKREVAYHPGTYGTARQTLGLEIGSKEEQEFGRLFREMNEAISDYNNKVRKKIWKSVTDAGGNKTVKKVLEEEGEAGTNRRKEMENAIQDYRNFINKRLEVLSPDAIEKLEREYELINPLKKGKNGRTYSQKDVDLMDSELLDKDAVIEIESSYKQQLAALEKQREKELLMLKEKYDQEQKDLEYNREKGLITEKEYNEQRATLDKNYNDLIKTNYEGNFEEMGVIQRKYWNKRNEIVRKEAERQEREEERKNAAALKEVKDEESNFKMWQEIEKRKFELTKHTATEEKKFVMEQQMELLKWRMDHAKALGISDDMLEVMREEFRQMQEQYAKGNYSNGKQNIKGNYTSLMDILFPGWDNDQKNALDSVFDQAKAALNSWMDARKAAADQAKQLADDEVSAAENALNREIDLRNQGYANDVALREKELADAKDAQRRAAEEQKKVAQEQILLDAAMQTSSMITASANILKQFPNPAAWIPMMAAMWGAFAYAKVKAYQASTKSIKFKDGGVMLLEGGSHESGHDVNLGIGPDGSNLRAEGGEYFAVINKRSSRKYGSAIPAVVNALNSGMFEDRYIKTSDAVGLLPRIIRADDGSMVDLSAVESGVGQLVKQGERSWSTEGEYRVMRYKNLTRRVRIN